VIGCKEGFTQRAAYSPTGVGLFGIVLFLYTPKTLISLFFQVNQN